MYIRPDSYFPTLKFFTTVDERDAAFQVIRQRNIQQPPIPVQQLTISAGSCVHLYYEFWISNVVTF